MTVLVFDLQLWNVLSHCQRRVFISTCDYKYYSFPLSAQERCQRWIISVCSWRERQADSVLYIRSVASILQGKKGFTGPRRFNFVPSIAGTKAGDAETVKLVYELE